MNPPPAHGKADAPRVSILMPACDAAAFIGRAVQSVLTQTEPAWELLVLDDASADATCVALAPFLADPRIRLLRDECRRGLGATLNRGLDAALAPCIAYLPADDLWYRDHLASLLAILDADDTSAASADAAGATAIDLVYAAVRHHYNRRSAGAIPGDGLQLVQCLHRRSTARWTTAAECISDDLERLGWQRFAAPGRRRASGRLTCEWVDHPDKLIHLLREPTGGLNAYRARHGCSQPLRFHATTGNPVDEVQLYRHDRERADTPRAADGLTIVLAGELAYNADRVLALEEAGQRLLGLWLDRPHWYNTVGPLPFGHVTDLPRHDWPAALQRSAADVILAGHNWQAVPFCRQVLTQTRHPGRRLPFVWHFKEGPFICLERGTWPQLVELYLQADGLIFPTVELRDWVAQAIPGACGRVPELILDADLPRARWFDAAPRPLHGAADGALHTVVPGRPIGLNPPMVAELAAANIHLHFYGDYTHGQWRGWIDSVRRLAPGHLHLHGHVDCDRWVAEFSRYDAGWLHWFTSRNDGDIARADWDDLNLPARLATLAAAGLPVLQRDNRGQRVATQGLTDAAGYGLAGTELAGLIAALHDPQQRQAARTAMQAHRLDHAFETHVPRLLEFLRGVIRHSRNGPP